jgi:opacity protein-like surface antigen
MKIKSTKKIALVFLTLQIFVVTSYADSDLKGGPYIGAAIGYDLPVYHENTSLKNSIFQTTQIRDHVAHGAVGGVFLGYGKYFNIVYLGGEAFGNVYSGTDKSYANQTQGGVNVISSSERQINQSYGLSAIPGIKLNKMTLLYGRLGYVRGNFTSNLSRSTSVTGSLPGVSSSANLNGIDFGIGIEVLLRENMSMRGEFKHSNYFGNVIVNPGANFSPRDNMATLGLVYKL